MLLHQQRDTLAKTREPAPALHPLAVIGANISAARAEAGLDAADLAARLKIAAVTLDCYERGARDIPVRTLAALARALGCPIGRLFAGLPGSAPTTETGAEARRLAEAFERLPDAAARRNVLDLVAGIAKFRR